MHTYALLILLLTPSGKADIYKLDKGLTLEDCGYAMAQTQDVIDLGQDGKLDTRGKRFSMVCEVEPPH